MMATGINLRIQNSKVPICAEYKIKHLEYLIWHHICIHSLLSYTNCDPIRSDPHLLLCFPGSQDFSFSPRRWKSIPSDLVEQQTTTCAITCLSVDPSASWKNNPSFLRAFQRQSLHSFTCTHLTSLLCVLCRPSPNWAHTPQATLTCS